MIDQLHEVMTPDEVAMLLRIARRTVTRMALDGEIPCRIVRGRGGRRYLFSREAVMAWLEQRAPGEPRA